MNFTVLSRLVSNTMCLNPHQAHAVALGRNATEFERMKHYTEIVEEHFNKIHSYDVSLVHFLSSYQDIKI